MSKLIPAAILALAVLGSCSPRQLCIDAATRDLRVLTRLIAGTEANLQRGYGLQDVTRTETRWVICDRGEPATATTPGRAARRCLEDFDYTVTRPVAIDLNDETRKLASMRTRQRALNRAAGPAITQCQLEHPK